MPDVSSAELVPKKKKIKAVSVLKKATQIIIVCQNSLPSCIISITPCVELYQTSAGDGFPLSFECTRTHCSNCRLNLNPLPWDWRRLQTGPSGISSLCLVQPVFTLLQILKPNHWFTLKLHCRLAMSLVFFSFKDRHPLKAWPLRSQVFVFWCYFKANLTLLVLTHTKKPGLRKYAKETKKIPFEIFLFLSSNIKCKLHKSFFLSVIQGFY